MRKLLIFLSISLCFTLIQYSNGAPIGPVSMESEEDDSVETKAEPSLTAIRDSNDQSDESDETIPKSNSIADQVDESDQSSEERTKVVGALELTRNLEEQNSHSGNQDDDNDQSNVASIRKILRNSDED